MGSRRESFALTLGLLAVATCATPHIVEAQRAVESQLVIGAGSGTDATGTRSSALTIAPTLQLRPATGLAIDLGAQGTRFANEQWAASGTGALGIRLPVARFLTATLGANAALTTTAHGARYTSADVTPALEVPLGRLALFAGARVAHGGVRLDRDVTAPSLPFQQPARTAGYSASETLQSGVFGGALRFTGTSTSGSIAYREERGRMDDASLVDRGLTTSVTQGRASLTAAAGQRTFSGDAEMFGSAAASYAVRPGFAVQVAGGRYAADPLTNAMGGTYLNAGIILSTQRAPGSLERPAPIRLRGAPAPQPGTTRLAIHAPGAAKVEIAGDWSAWRPVAAQRAAGGHWYADVRLAPGRYRYAFRVDGNQWTVPAGTKAVDDGFGGKSAWLTVP